MTKSAAREFTWRGVLCLLAVACSACNQASRHHHQLVRYYRDGIPETRPSLQLGILNVAANTWKWKNSNGESSYPQKRSSQSSVAISVRRPSQNYYLDLAFSPNVPPSFLRVAVLDWWPNGRWGRPTDPIVASGGATLIGSRITQGCVHLRKGQLSIQLSPSAWSVAKAIVVSGLWIPRHDYGNYKVGDNQESWSIKVD
jgi:hypothetical protein